MTGSKLRAALGMSCLALTLIVAGCGGGDGGADTAQAQVGGGSGSGGGSGGSGGGGSGGGGSSIPLTITNTSPSNYVWADLAEGTAVYIDRSYSFDDLPSSVIGIQFLQTANDDKAVSDPAAISFDVNQAVTVLVAYDARVSNPPFWLQSWTQTGETWITTDTDLDVFRKDFPAGTVTLGGNETGLSMYSVGVMTQGGGSGGGPLTIGGGPPPTAATEGMAYSFVPTASGGTGGRTFSVSNRPSWANFNSSTGALTGTPGMGDIGTTTSNIVISVSDSQGGTDSLDPFSIEVFASGNGAATVSWTAPTLNEDSSPLTDLAGFKIYYGTSVGNYPNEKRVQNPGLTTAMVENLAPGTWNFVVTAYDIYGNESGYSNVATKTISP